MKNLSTIGRIFYGIAIAGIGVEAICSRHVPYMLIPPTHFSMPLLAILAYISGMLIILAGVCIIFGKKIMPISLLLGGTLLLIFCFYFIPYEFMANSNYMNFGEWENAEKELALSGGVFVIAGSFSEKNKNSLIIFLAKLIPLGAILFSLTMICFGIDHFLYAKDVFDYVPSWIPYHVFWTYFAGTALLGSGIAIILKIKLRLIAILLGIMIFIWFIILHIPRVIVSPSAYMGGEVTSAFLALAYSGIAYVIAGTSKKTLP